MGGARRDVHQRALGLLAVRQRSRRELERRLLQAGFEPVEVDAELDRLEGVGLVDDEVFARAVVESRGTRRGEAPRLVAQRLRQAGVEPGTIAQVLDDAALDEQAGADALARARLSRLTSLEPAAAFQRLTGYIARRGYAPEVARAAARRALAWQVEPD